MILEMQCKCKVAATKKSHEEALYCEKCKAVDNWKKLGLLS